MGGLYGERVLRNAVWLRPGAGIRPASSLHLYHVIDRNMKNEFIKLVQGENRHTDNLEDLHNKNKLTDDCYLTVQEILKTRYRKDMYLVLNSLVDAK